MAAFSVAPWLSLECQIPQGTEGREELGRWVHITLNVNFGPWELGDLGKSLTSGRLLSVIKWAFSLSKRNGGDSREKVKPKHAFKAKDVSTW